MFFSYRIYGILLVNILFVVGQDKPKWDYILFSQRWAPSDCEDWHSLNESASCYDVPRSYWTVHGLWPGNTTGNDPFYCNETPLNISKISTIMDSLVNRWPTTRNLTNNFDDDCDEFWRHEWDKHGTCAMTLPEYATIFDYFNKSLEINRRLDVYTSLEKHGIIPDNNKKYNFTLISDILRKEFGKLPDVTCTTDNLIHEVRNCFDKQSNLVDCVKIQTNCNQTLPILYQ